MDILLNNWFAIISNRKTHLMRLSGPPTMRGNNHWNNKSNPDLDPITLEHIIAEMETSDNHFIPPARVCYSDHEYSVSKRKSILKMNKLQLKRKFTRIYNDLVPKENVQGFTTKDKIRNRKYEWKWLCHKKYWKCKCIWYVNIQLSLKRRQTIYKIGGDWVS